LMVLVRDFPKVSEAKAWFEKVRNKLGIFDEYEAVKQEYIETKAQYNQHMLKDFIYLKCACGFFYTTFDKSNYGSRYFEEDPTCPRCHASLKQSS